MLLIYIFPLSSVLYHNFEQCSHDRKDFSHVSANQSISKFRSFLIIVRIRHSALFSKYVLLSQQKRCGFCKKKIRLICDNIDQNRGHNCQLIHKLKRPVKLFIQIEVGLRQNLNQNYDKRALLFQVLLQLRTKDFFNYTIRFVITVFTAKCYKKCTILYVLLLYVIKLF